MNKTYDALILCGGGEKVIAAIGVLRELFQDDGMPPCNTIVGTSAGAMLGVMLGVGTPLDRCEALVRSYFSTDLVGRVDADASTAGDDDSVGLLDGSRVVGDFVRRIVWNALGCANCTFKEFASRTGVDLIVPACNLTSSRTELMCVQRTPYMDVVTAVCMSACVPLVFKPVRHAGCFYVDGAVYGEPMLEALRPFYACEHMRCLLIYIQNDPGGGDSSCGNLVSFCSHLIASMLHRRNQDAFERCSSNPNVRAVCVTLPRHMNKSIIVRAFTNGSAVFCVDDQQVRDLLEAGRSAVSSSSCPRPPLLLAPEQETQPALQVLDGCEGYGPEHVVAHGE